MQGLTDLAEYFSAAVPKMGKVEIALEAFESLHYGNMVSHPTVNLESFHMQRAFPCLRDEISFGMKRSYPVKVSQEI